MQGIAEWLNAKIGTIIQAPGYFDEPLLFAGEGKALRSAAKEAGFSINELIDACEGDIEKYIMDQQNAFTDASVANRGNRP